MRISLLVLLTQFAVAPLAAQRPYVPSDSTILAVIKTRVDSKLAPGVVVGFLDPDGRRRIVAYGSSGTSRPLDENTVFEIGSITKSFTATVLADLALRGQLSLDDPLSKFLPPGAKAPTRGGREITLLDLATHTSGLPRGPNNMGRVVDPLNPAADYTAEQMYEFLSSHTLRRDIGSEYEYSNLAFMLLGDVVRRAAGVAAWEDLVSSRILEPLGMRDTRVTLTADMRSRLAAGYDEGGFPAPLITFQPNLGGGGTLKSTARDMLTYLAANLDAERNPRRNPLAGAMHSAHQDRRAADTGRVGLSWNRLPINSTDTIIYKTGGTAGYRSLAAFIPSRRTAVIVLVNSAPNSYDLAFHLLEPSLPLVPPVRPVWAIDSPLPLGPEILARYAGTYERTDGIRVVVSRAADTLFVQQGQGPRRRLFAASEQSFSARGSPIRYTFQRDSAGQFTTLVTNNDGTEFVLRRVP